MIIAKRENERRQYKMDKERDWREEKGMRKNGMIKAIINPIIVSESSCAETGIPEPEHGTNTLAVIRYEYATHGKETRESMRAYIENRVSYESRLKAVRDGLRMYQQTEEGNGCRNEGN